MKTPVPFPKQHPLLSSRDHFVDSFDKLFDRIIQTNFPTLTSEFGVDVISKGAYPRVNVIAYLDRVEFTAELAGMTKEDVNIELKDSCLTISGHTKASFENEPSEEAIYILRELKRSKFSRSFTLHENLDAENTEASFENGVLLIKIPYVSPKERQSKVIKIN